MRKVSIGLLGGVLVLALIWACGGGRPVVTGNDPSTISGTVLITPVSGATVSLVTLSSGFTRGAVVVSGKTDETGAFSLTLPATQPSDMMLVATAGNYTEPSIGLGVQLGSNELTYVLPAVKSTSQKIEGIQVTPISTLAAAFAGYHVVKDGKSVADALAEAQQHLHKHFGGVDWTTVPPGDLTSADAGVTNLSDSAREGLVLAGLSWLAKQQAETSGVSPGLVVNAATLTTLLAKDATDGTLDGLQGTAQLKSSMVGLTGVTLRSELVSAMTAFISSSRNSSALKLSDITAFLAAIGTDDDAYLFCPGQVPGAGCGSGPVDTEPPVIAFTKPNDGAGVAGSVAVEVHASDNVAIKTLAFTAPASLTTVTPVFANSNREGILTATLDVSALPDGPVTITAQTTDTAGNPAAKTITVKVSNTGPRINISAPSDSTTVKGSIIITASATAQAPGATISKLELVSPPPGVGADNLPAADSFAASWDTTQALEGAQVLTFRATDSFGTATETSVTVTVDNVPFGTVKATVSFGAPVAGLEVKLLAIDDATGAPVAGRAGGPILGDSLATLTDDKLGVVSFALTQENYEGPVQLVATGQAASYVDPSDLSTVVTLPSTFALTALVAHYKTGSAIDLPVTGWTTLADTAAIAYAAGHNPAQPTPISLTKAIGLIDPLFSAHVSSTPWAVRTVFPVSLTTNPQSLRDVAYAAFPDVAFNSLARSIANDVGLTPGTGFSGPMLLDLLRQDLADGQFDGKAAGAQLKTGGTSPYSLTANTTRFKQAIALDVFVRSTANKSGLRRVDLQSSGIYDTMSNDVSVLYPAGSSPTPFDNQPPTFAAVVVFSNGALAGSAPVGSSKVVGGTITVDATGSDTSGMASLTLVVNGNLPLIPTIVPTPAHFNGTFDTTKLPDGPLTITTTACDQVANCASSDTVVLVDNTAPTIAVTKPVAGTFSGNIDVDASATDANAVASLVLSGLSGFTDTDGAPGHVAGSWAPGSTPDGALSISFKGCDVAGNCSSKAVTGVVLDRTPPSVSWHAAPAPRTNKTTIAVVVDATDATGVAGVSVKSSAGGGTIVAATKSGSSWTATMPIDTTGPATTLTAWATDTATPANSGQGKGAPYEVTASVVYDITPPTVAWNVVFSNGALVKVAPIGASKLLSGIVDFVADAADPSGVASLTIDESVNGNVYSPQAGSSTAHFVGQLDSYSGDYYEGADSLVAHACDGLGNCGTVAYPFVFDLSPPHITVAKPTLGSSVYLSAATDIDVSATDSSGVTAVTASAPFTTTLKDQDSSVTRFYAPASSWTITSGFADGPTAFTFSATDSVGNQGSGVYAVNIDRTAPSVVINSAPPAYTRSTSGTISATFTDTGAHVAKAWAANKTTGAAAVAGTCVPSGASSACTFSLSLASGAQNSIAVWADDAALPPNSGAGNPTIVTTSVDTTPPFVFTRAPISYRPEVGLKVATDSVTGRPVMPVQYQQQQSPVAVTEGSTVYKIRSKTGAGDDNEPFLRWAVQVDAAPAAPPQNGTYSCTADATGAVGAGALRVSSATEGGYSLFELPLTAPALNGALGLMYCGVTFFDAAGNQTTRNFTVTLTLVGAPIVVVQDTNYGADNDAQSIWPYSVATNYAPLIGAEKRVVRYLVFNPNQETIWVGSGLGARSVTWTENWNSWTDESTGGPVGTISADGFSMPAYADWDTNPPGGTYGEPSQDVHTIASSNLHCSGVYGGHTMYGLGGTPCGAEKGYTYAPAHYLGDTGTMMACDGWRDHWSGYAGGKSYAVAASPNLRAYNNATSNGGETSGASAVSFFDPPTGNQYNGWVMGPATLGTASVMAVYSTLATPARPTAGVQANIFPILNSGQPSFTAGYFWKQTSQTSSYACGWCIGLACASGSGNWLNAGWSAYTFGYKLYSTTISYSSDVVFQSNADYDVGNVQGDVSAQPSTFATQHFSIVRY